MKILTSHIMNSNILSYIIRLYMNNRKRNEQSRNTYYKRREEYLKGKKCKSCGFSNWRALVFDHIKSLSHGGKTITNNLQILCQNCHHIKGIENKDWKKVHKGTRMGFNAHLSKKRLQEYLLVK